MGSVNSYTVVLSSFVVRDESGSVDQVATAEKFEALVNRYVAESETEESTIADAINATFDTHLGQRLPMPSLINTALLVKMSCPPENLKVLTEKAQKYVRANAGTKESGALFGISKGPLGGCHRWADVTESTSEKK